MNTDNLPIDEGLFFAFIESNEPLELQRDEDAREYPPIPQHSTIWLDAIEVEYFLGLSWINDTFDETDESQREKRRCDIREMDKNRFMVAKLDTPSELISRYFDGPPFYNWLVIKISHTDGVLVSVGRNYSVVEDDAQTMYLESVEHVNEEIGELLNGVFNVDFLEEIDSSEDDLGGGAPITPPIPNSGSEGSELIIEQPDEDMNFL